MAVATSSRKGRPCSRFGKGKTSKHRANRIDMTLVSYPISPTRGSLLLLCNTFAEDKKGEKVTMIRLIRLQEAHKTAWGEGKNKQRQHRKVSYKV